MQTDGGYGETQLELAAAGRGTFRGHPAGLSVIFFTEMWERFSYYGMRAILVLYMVAPHRDGGLEFDRHFAGELYGVYTMLVYITSIPGGFIADNYWGLRRSVLIGAIIIALGHFAMAVPSLPGFYTGLALIVIGTGLLKPNMSSMLGALYPPGDRRRDSGFSIYYMGVNIGATLAPFVCGFLAQSQEFKSILSSWKIDPFSCWHWGFAAAGVGMVFGILQFIARSRELGSVGLLPNKMSSPANPRVYSEQGPLTATDWQRLLAIGILFFFAMLFWSIYEQGGSSLNLFADSLTDCRLFGWQFPPSWMQSLSAIFVIVLAPVFSYLWVKLGSREPNTVAKFVLGLTFLGAGIAVMVPASLISAHGKVSPLWLVAVYFLMVLGEMCLSPVGLSLVTKLAPRKMLALTMGLWMLTNAFGNMLAGHLSTFFNNENVASMTHLFGGMTIAALISAGVLVLLMGQIRRLMAGVH